MAKKKKQKGMQSLATNTQVPSDGGKNKLRVFIASGSIVAVMLVCFIGLVGFSYAYTNVLPNVMIGDFAVGGMTKAAAEEYVHVQSEGLYEDATLNLTIYEDTHEIPVYRMIESINAMRSAENAFAVGRTGNPFQRAYGTVKALLGGAEVALAVDVNTEGLSTALKEITDVAIRKPSEATYEIKENTLSIYAGKPGVQFDSMLLETLLTEKISKMDFTDYTVETQLSDAPPIDIDKIAELVIGPASNAIVDKADGKTIIPEISGVDFDVEEARAIVGDGLEAQYDIPISHQPATVTAQDLAEKLFRDTLAIASTDMNEGNVPRTNNIRLASAEINGTILNPGEEFSYNGVVGERSEARGYSPAGAYANGQIVQEFGGGVCQPSSTLYMAVLRADLQVVERTNHSFTVAYTPLGEDATVDYGTLDFRFQNNTQYPVKILAEQSNGHMVMTIVGTKTTDKTVTTRTDVLETDSPSTIEKQDSSMKEGEARVEQSGITGYSTKTYKIITENGNTTEVLTNSSNYSKRDKIVYVGTKKTQVQPAPSTQQSQESESSQESTQDTTQETPS